MTQCLFREVVQLPHDAQNRRVQCPECGAYRYLLREQQRYPVHKAIAQRYVAPSWQRNESDAWEWMPVRFIVGISYTSESE